MSDVTNRDTTTAATISQVSMAAGTKIVIASGIAAPMRIGHRRPDAGEHGIGDRGHLEDAMLALELGGERVMGHELAGDLTREIGRQPLGLVVGDELLQLGIRGDRERGGLIGGGRKLRLALRIQLGELRPARRQHAGDRRDRRRDHQGVLVGSGAREPLEEPAVAMIASFATAVHERSDSAGPGPRESGRERPVGWWPRSSSSGCGSPCSADGTAQGHPSATCARQGP